MLSSSLSSSLSSLSSECDAGSVRVCVRVRVRARVSACACVQWGVAVIVLGGWCISMSVRVCSPYVSVS